ncbi:MAG: class I SAM-dependent methyltransferase [Fimbriimonadaceae bacterium]
MNASERFSDRVEDYAKYRPGYPEGLFDLLGRECGLREGCAVADLGSGTGIFAKALLARSATVYAVEPNGPMRAAAERELSGDGRFHSVAATAERSGLADASVDLVTCAQSFHWFDKTAAKREFRRVLKPSGWAAIVWNERLDDASPFMVAYEKALWDHCPDYANADHRNTVEDELREFFAPVPMQTASFPNEQRFDLAGLVGRSLSSSYAPKPGTNEHALYLEKLRVLFEKNNLGGTITFAYEAKVFFAPLNH